MLRTNFLNQSHLSFWKDRLQKKLSVLGIKLDTHTGQIFYQTNFQAIQLHYELVFIRHGETYGNCGQSTIRGKIDNELVKQGLKNKDNRIYQGNIDTEINKLTDMGQQQAREVATTLKKEWLDKGWVPDVVLLSPLSRAIDTARPFLEQNNLLEHYIVDDSIREMSFGAWENRRVCDFPPNDPCHSFYNDKQDALVKQSGINCNGNHQEAESFADVLLRANQVLLDLNSKYSGKKIVMFSHSMFGAACCILSGHGQKNENGDYLAFDGQRNNGKSYTMPHTSPFLLTGHNPTVTHQF